MVAWPQYYVSILLNSLLYAHCRHDWCCHCINSVNLRVHHHLELAAEEWERCICEAFQCQVACTVSFHAISSMPRPHSRFQGDYSHVQTSGHSCKLSSLLHLWRCWNSSWRVIVLALAPPFQRRVSRWGKSSGLFFRPTPSWLPPGRSTRSIACFKLGCKS